jgi:Domain of unknown function (DUF4129)
MHGIARTLSVVLSLAATPPQNDVARQVLEAERCQTELPVESGPRAGGAASAWQRSATRQAGDAPALLAPLSVASSLGAVVVAALVVVSLLAAILHRQPASPGIAPPAAAPRARPAGLRSARAPRGDDFEQLARAGRFSEAIHALLLRALSETESGPTRPALTSREIVRSLRLGREARASLEALVSAVEWAHFGGRPAGLAEYQASLAEYQRLASAWARQR